MITVEIVLPNGSSVTSLPLETTKDDFIKGLDEDDFVDFPALDGEGREATFCFPTIRVKYDCVLVFREVE